MASDYSGTYASIVFLVNGVSLKILKRTFVVVVTLIIFAVSTYAAVAKDITGPGAHKRISDGLSSHPVWSMPPMDSNERSGKISRYVKRATYVLLSGDESLCVDALKRINSSSEGDILTPSYVVQSLDHPDYSGLIAHCKSPLNLNHSNSGNSQSSYDFIASSNYEFYNAEIFFGEGAWLFFAEGGRPDCSAGVSDDCDLILGFVTLGKSFNTKTCSVLQDYNMFGATRLLPIKSRHSVEYRRQENFYALVNIDRPALLIYRTDYHPLDSCSNKSGCLPTKEGTDLFLHLLSSADSYDSCHFKPVNFLNEDF